MSKLLILTKVGKALKLKKYLTMIKLKVSLSSNKRKRIPQKYTQKSLNAERFSNAQKLFHQGQYHYAKQRIV